MNSAIVLLGLLSLVQMVAGKPEGPCYPGEERDKVTGKCRNCKDGYFSTHGKRCEQCTTCHKGQSQMHECKLSRNTLCLCGEGKYEKNGICKDCDNCPAGMYQRRECGHNLNRVCETCPKGHYTKHSNAKKCFPNAYTTALPANEIHYHNETSDKLIVSVIALGSFLIIVVAVALYFLSRRKRRRRNRVITNNNPGFEEAAPLNPLLMEEEADENHVHMENVPYSVFEDLALKLNPEESNNWRKLASHLKMSNDKIRNLALLPQMATQQLLDEWIVNPNATAYRLHTVLTYMGRYDASILLEPYLFKELNSTV